VWLCSGERPFECRVCKMAFTTNGNMHRHMRIHEKEVSSTTQAEHPDSPQSLTVSPSSCSPRVKKRPVVRASSSSGSSGWSSNVSDDIKGFRRKLQPGSPVKKISDGAIDLRQNKAGTLLLDEPLPASLSQPVSSLSLHDAFLALTSC